jgi:transposase
MEAKRPLSDLDWALTPQAVKQYIVELENIVGQLAKRHEALEKRTDTLETRLNQNSQNSSKPPSSDGPFKKPKRKRKKGKRKRGGQKGHKGHRQQMLAPTAVKNLLPDRCQCGQLSLDR